MIITVSGAPGTGTTTLARGLSEELGLRWINSGELFRKMAGEKKVSVRELNRLAELSPEIDYRIDDAQRALAREGPGIFEGRLAGHLIDANLKILLKANLKARAERIAKRESRLMGNTQQETREREECEARRYKKYYNIDINDCCIYDLVIDSGKFDEPSSVSIVLAAIKAMRI